MDLQSHLLNTKPLLYAAPQCRCRALIPVSEPHKHTVIHLQLTPKTLPLTFAKRHLKAQRKPLLIFLSAGRFWKIIGIMACHPSSCWVCSDWHDDPCPYNCKLALITIYSSPFPRVQLCCCVLPLEVKGSKEGFQSLTKTWGGKKGGRSELSFHQQRYLKNTCILKIRGP